MTPAEIIRIKRDGGELGAEEIDAFVQGATDGSFAPYQLSAMLMAIYLRGMSDRETARLTLAMANSGGTVDLGGVTGKTADKHSTGGVGDTTTFIVAPLVAACGVKVAKMSGRGLGFTGGTVDKLESIPGMRTRFTAAELARQVERIGIAVVGQSDELAPADKTLYGLRDVTATVESLPLIASSILSKKIASGCDCVILDVKAGSGALMETIEKSTELARTLVRIARLCGRKFGALITGMDEPLGRNVGNALEVEEAIRILSGEAGGALLAVSLYLGAQMLIGVGAAGDRAEAIGWLTEKLRSGEGLSKFAAMIRAQGGDERVAYDPSRLPRAERSVPVAAERGGYVTGIRASEIGYASLAMGAGRARAEDTPDPAAGIVMLARIGDRVERGDAVCELRAGPRSDVARAAELARGAFRIGDAPPAPSPLIYAAVDGDGVEELNLTRAEAMRACGIAE